MSISCCKNYSLYFSLGSDSLVEKTIDSIVEQENHEWLEENRELSTSEFDTFLFEKPDWDKTKKIYLTIEAWLNGPNALIPTWKVSGGLHFGMSPSDMRESLTSKLKEMAQYGRVKLESSIERREEYFPSDNSCHDLTRVWGAEYLEEQLVGDAHVKAARHFIVIKDNASAIDINVWLRDDNYSFVNSISSSAYVLAEKIKGNPKAFECRSVSLTRSGFYDFSSPGNILEDVNGVNYVVDTESKSFNKPPMNRKASVVTRYLKKRFHFLHSREPSIQINIPLTDIF